MARDITFFIVVAVILISVLSLAANLFFAARDNERHFEQKSAEYLSFLKEGLEIPLWNFELPTVAKLGEMMMANDIVASLIIKDSNGAVTFEGRKKSETVSVKKTANIQYRDVMVGSVELGLSKRLYREQQKSIFLVGLLTIIIVILFVFWLVTYSASRYLKQPLDEFAARIEAIADGRYQYEVPAVSHIELEGIMERFNQMAARIAEREASLVTSNRALRLEIRERKKAEALLRESEQRYRTLNDNIPVGVFRSKYNGEIVSSNPALLRILNIPETLDGHVINANDFNISPEDRRRLFQEMARSGQVKGFECKLQGFNQETIWVSITARGIEADDHRIQYIDGIIEDISERKRSEEERDKLQNQLIQLQKMEAIGTLAGGIAHDFNNILGGIIGYSELALEQVKGPGGDLIDYIRRILEAGNRARDLVGQILNFSRQGASVRVALKVSPLLKECIKLLRSFLPKTIVIDSRIKVSDDTILADSTQIHQVIMNLGTNAFHAMRDNGGRLTFQLENVALDMPHQSSGITIMPGYYLKLSVTDTGPGIPSHIRDRIFDPYFTTKKVNEGTGLGLSVSLGIVKSHGGLIEIETTSETGTSFAVFLPSTTEKAVDTLPDRPALKKGNNERLLVVDDEPLFLDILCHILKLLAYHVTAVPSSAAALEKLRENPEDFDVLISDQTMPEMTGIQLAAEARKINPRLPIILCTGYSEKVNKTTAANFGISRFLMKPISQHELATAVREVLQDGVL